MGRASGENEQIELQLPSGIRHLRSQQRIRELVAADNLDGFWYHATSRRFDEFNFKVRRDRRNTSDWNTLMGVHFARDGQGVREHFLFGKGRVIQARLDIRNPARFGDEYEFERLAFRALQARNGWSEKMLAMKIHPGTRSPLSKRLRVEFLEYLNGTGWRDPRGHRSLLNEPANVSHVAKAVKEQLVEQGYDGVIYGNSFDFHCVSAIAFEPAQIEIVSHNWQPLAAQAA